MVDWFRKKLEDWKARRQLAREVDPRNFKRMAHEIRDLAILASQLSPRSKDIRSLIRNVVTEMDRLSEMADRPEFRRLSTGKKIMLRQGLIESREQLLESIESAPSPTETLQ